MQFIEQVPLAPFTTLGIGGPARWFAEALTEADLFEAVAFAKDRDIPLFALGGGSNLLVSDEGFPGLVVRVALKGLELEEHGEEGRFSVAAGEDWDAFVTRTVERNFGGIECLAGIPGTIGGTPVQNVGAYGQEVSATIQMVRALDRSTGEFVNLSHEECGFAYRRSIFNTNERGRFLVTWVVYALVSGIEPAISYPDVTRYFKDLQGRPTLAQAATAVRAIRRKKGMLLVEGDPDCASAGSFFKNPIVDRAVLDRIAALSAAQVPYYPAEGGRVKIPAAWLLEQAGFHKGLVAGQAGISSRHPLALINRGGARASEVVSLRDRITAAVRERFGILLEPEPVWVGPDA